MYTEENTMVYCVNTGKMADILVEGAPCVITPKETGIPWQWEAIQVDGVWIGTNTHNPNKLCKEFLPKYFSKPFKSEFKIENIRVDFADKNTLIEVKHVHWLKDKTFIFPDCITERSSKQLKTLSNLTDWNRYLIYIVQRNERYAVSSLESIDQNYFKMVQIAKESGVQFLAFNCKIDENSIEISEQLEVI